jgi:hypothetical protein
VSILPILTELTHLSELSWVQPSSAVTVATMAATGGGVLIESQGSRAPTQEGMFWSLSTGVLPVCVRSGMSLT